MTSAKPQPTATTAPRCAVGFDVREQAGKLIVAVNAAGGAAGEVDAAAAPGLLAAIQTAQNAVVATQLLAFEQRWHLHGRAAFADPLARQAYGLVDFAMILAGCAAHDFSLETFLGGIAGLVELPEGAAVPGTTIALADISGDIEAFARASLASEATSIVLGLDSCGGLAGLRRIAAIGRALGMTVCLRAPRTSARIDAFAVCVARALGLAISGADAPSAPVLEIEPRSRIRRIRVRRIKLPVSYPYVSAMYLTQHVFRTIVEIETGDGVVGLGECNGSEDAFANVQRLARGVVGQDANDRRGIARRFSAVGYSNASGRSGWQALAGIELACWDNTARRYGLALADLVGRADPADSVNAVCLLPSARLATLPTRAELAVHFADVKNARGVVELALAGRERYGFTTFKYKSVGNNAAWDFAVMSGLRSALGSQAHLRFDPNASYPTAAAQRLCRDMEPLGLEFYEDPTDGIEGLARLRNATGAAKLARPIASNMVLVHFDQFAPTVRRSAIDVLLGDLFNWGGVETYRDMAAAAECFGLTGAIHSFYETSIGTAANIHLALGLGLTTHANDQGHQDIAADVAVDGAIKLAGGRLTLPPGPGLGIALDDARIKTLTVEDVTVEAGR